MTSLNYDAFLNERCQNAFHTGTCKSKVNRNTNQYSTTNYYENFHQKIHISTNGYYGHQPTKLPAAEEVRTDCDMIYTPLGPAGAQNAVGSCPARKRIISDDVNLIACKKLRIDEGATGAPRPMHTEPDNSHCYVTLPCDWLSEGAAAMPRPTHTNPDISRCLMTHMI